jgi:two-component system, NarL family, nitrate/nitrite response regulator NarL
LTQESVPAIQVLLASTQTIFRAGLRGLLDREPDMRVVGEASAATDVLRLIGETKPDIVLLDLPFRGLTDRGNFSPLRNLFGQTPTLLLSDKAGDPDAAQALREGAGGFVLKSSNSDVLIRGIRGILQGQYWLGSEQAVDSWTVSSRADTHKAAEKNVSNSKCFGLTGREMEVVQGIVSGFSNKELACFLSISDETVKHHLTNIFDKVGVYNRLELALFAIHHGLVGKTGTGSGYAVHE